MALGKIFGKLLGNKAQKDMKALMPIVAPIKTVYERIKVLTNDELRVETKKLKKHIADTIQTENAQIASLRADIEEKNLDIDEREKVYQQIDSVEEDVDEKLKKVLDKILPTAFAIVKETARRFVENEEIIVTANDNDRELAVERDFVNIKEKNAIYHNSWIAGGNKITWNMVHYDVQLIGGVVLHQGKVAEMATGEGKTLVATLPVFLNALTGRGVHVVTVNDYLAKRDAEWMGPIFQFHGFSVDCIDKHKPNSKERKQAYHCDITYGTNNEFGFDYLRDNMAIDSDDLVQRKHNFSIVDEVDSVLIDDARTPLIISGPVPKGDNQLFDEFKPQVERVVKTQRQLIHSIFTQSKKLIDSSDSKEKEEGALLLFRTYKGLPKYKPLIKFLSEQGSKALLRKTENFYMSDNNKNMHIATDPLYFIIDEKQNSIELTDKGIDLLSGNTDDPEFFVLPDIGSQVADIEKSNMSADEKITKKDELIQNYAIRSERVHTVNQLLKAYTLFEKDVEYVLIDNKIKIVDEQTGRIMEGRRYSDGLHQAIEAKENVKVEAATQTYATITLQNYFRMYNKLSGMTGTAETEAGELWDIYKLDVVVIPTNRSIIRDDRNDLVYKTKREKFNAVIQEIEDLNEKKRPVLVGTTSVEISELLSRMLKIRGIRHNVLNAKRHQHEADIVAEAGKSGTVTIATNMAGRGTDIRLMNEVIEAGGLAIVGTERHESRRVDRQLRGRSGRQGDPGSSQFFVSLEDNLLRLFGSERVIKIMDRMGLKDGEVIQSGMITNQIERAQKKVEENNFGIRKRLLEYDDVMNSQREVIYKKRRHALLGERLRVDISNTIYDVCESLVSNYESDDSEVFNHELIRILSIDPPLTNKQMLSLSAEAIIDKLFNISRKSYDRKTLSICQQAMPVIKNIYENRRSSFENIIIPVTDGVKLFHVVTNLEKAYKTNGEEIVRSYEKSVVLSHIDEVWKEHLRKMDDLKQSVQTATYEQKDPLLIYKFEAFNLFKNMVEETNKNIVSSLMKGQIYIREADEVREAEKQKTDLSRLQTQKDEFSRNGESRQNNKSKATPVRVGEKVGRNDPCPCESGKKYKNCHGKL